MEPELLEANTIQYFTIARNIVSKDEHTWLWIDHSSNGRFTSEQEAISEAERLTRAMVSGTGNPYFAVRITESKTVEAVKWQTVANSSTE